MSSQLTSSASIPPRNTLEIVRDSLARRQAAEWRFQWYGRMAIIIGMAFLSLSFIIIFGRGYTAFVQTYIQLTIHFDPEIIDPTGSRDPNTLASADYASLWRKSLREVFPDVSSRQDVRALYALMSSGAAYQLRRMVLNNPNIIGDTRSVWLLADDVVDSFYKGHIKAYEREDLRPISDQQIAWVEELSYNGRLFVFFNTQFFTNGDSREPELAGILGALLGSFYTMIVILVLSVPLGIAAALYLEEFAPKNFWTDLIEVNINNLAAVPPIIFGLLGLAVFIHLFGIPRSTPLIGGLVLSLMVLPTIIISSRSALKSVRPSIREAALSLGASRTQAVFHHVLPLAIPGILTGVIISLAQALGETAPLLMIGMVAFIVDTPQGILDPATALPVQSFLWSDMPERAFVERTSATMIILLFFLIVMNATAVILRHRFEQRF